MNLVFGHDKAIADWASKQYGQSMRNWSHAIGVIDKTGALRGAAVLHDFNGYNVELTYVGPLTLTAGVVKGLMRFIFWTVKAHRITTRTQRGNKALCHGLPKIGFKLEGVMKHYYGPYKRLDAILFGLLANDAVRFIGECP